MRVDYYDYLDDDYYEDNFQPITRKDKAPKQKQYTKVKKQDYRKEKDYKKKTQEMFDEI